MMVVDSRVGVLILFGLLIDEDLNMAVVGQQSKGVDIVKLVHPEITFVKKDDWSLNSAYAPMTTWNNQVQAKTYTKKVALVRQSDNPLDPWYRVFLYASIRVTLDPYEDREINYRDRQDYEQTSDLRMLSGDIMWAHISVDFLMDSG